MNSYIFLQTKIKDMRKFSLIALGTWLILATMGFGGDKYETLKIGAKAPMIDNKMTATNGSEASLKSLKGDSFLAEIMKFKN